MRPLRRPFGAAQVSILSGTEAAAFDRLAIESLGVPSLVLIEAAGRAAAGVVDQLFPVGPVVVLAGKGNNGSDAVVLARTLFAWGRDTTLVPIWEEVDTALLHGWDIPVGSLADAEGAISSGAVVVDGILGTGLRGAPRGAAAEAIALVERHSTPVVALDVPSGIDADSGKVYSPAVRADVTIGFGAAKLGSVLFPAREQVGRLVVVDIGFPPMTESTTSFVTPAWAHARLPVRSPTSHKNAVGAVCVVGGRKGMAGAAVLASQAALRAGAGYVRVVSAPDNRGIIQAAIPEAVFVDWTDMAAVETAVAASKAVLVGPGMGIEEEAASALKAVLSVISADPQSGAPPLILDADALTLVASRWQGEGRSAAGFDLPPRVLLTPHPGEMTRLTGGTREDVLTDPLGTARALASHRRVAVLLKGAPTLIVAPDGDTRVAGSQSSDMATAGMGDTLAGIIASLSAQGLSIPDAAGVALEVSAWSAALSGLGGGLTPTDVIRHLQPALQDDGVGHSELTLPFVLFDQDPPR